MTSIHHDPIRIGMLFSETGVTSEIENSQRLGTLLAVDEINAAGGIGGRELQVIAHDPQSRPALFRSLAERLVREDGVRLIAGCYTSSARKAVMPVLDRWNALLLYPTLYEGFEFSRHVFYTGAAPNQNSVQLAEFMTRHFGTRVFMVGSDYVFPYESNRIMSDLVLERGGEKLAELYLPLDARQDDFTAVAKRIRQAAPDFVFSTVVGESTAMLHRAFRSAGLDPARTPIASLSTCEAEVHQMGAEFAEGHITAAPYFQTVDTDTNRRTLAAYRARNGSEHPANQCWEAACFQMHLLADALGRADPDDVESVRRALPGTEVDAPQGRVRIDEENHHTHLRPRIGRVDAAGRFEILEEARERVRPDPYLVSHTLDDWSVRTALRATV